MRTRSLDGGSRSPTRAWRCSPRSSSAASSSPCSANHYTRAEDAYLNASAQLVVADPPPLTTMQDLTSWAQAAALTTQTRVQVYSQDGTLVVDSGSPNTLDAETLLGRGEGFGHGRETTTGCRTRSATACSAPAAARAPAGRSPWTWATAPT